MPALTPARAALVAGVVAALVYANSLGNGWAMDDVYVVQRNEVVHSVGSALTHWFHPYWPETSEGQGGLYRPVTLLSYAVDWTLSGGRPWWSHAVNVLLHGVATGLVVLVLGRWLSGIGLLGAGLVFAVHPVHVEAVANVVGRAEILAACGILAAVLAARRYRRAAGAGAGGWLVLTVLAAGFAMGSKEHGVIAVGAVAVDHWLDSEKEPLLRLTPYVLLAALTAAFGYVWQAIAGPYTGDTVTAAIRWLSPGERLATAVPAQLDAVRLLVWPMVLAADYSPLVIPQRTEWGFVATVAALTSAALLCLAFAVRRRAPAVAFGILVAAGSFLPTSNLLFGAGILMAERTLYLAALAPACVVGYLAGAPLAPRPRRLLLGALTLLLVVFSVRTLTRTPVWRHTNVAVTELLLTHPENYRGHLWVGEMYAIAGDSSRAISEFMTAGHLFADPMNVRYTIPVANRTGKHALAIEAGTDAYAKVPGHPVVGRLLVEALLLARKADSAETVAREAVRISSGSVVANETYLDFLKRTDAPPWRHYFARARLAWLRYRFGEAGALLDSAAAAVRDTPDATGLCWELEASGPQAAGLRPALRDELAELARSRDDERCGV